ncbi:unnamed protein product [Rotaria magnacalcarata]|uniref:Uncharacterized protein n=4 Tax=Rotaria magnacalcarata TaxID=392030 RepID=A0A814TTS4_9BILA|nr:unnamed protein product [Rotaria magnacalcarata]CAF1450412.1 unnamed protein product [Rotaria magnacalcarata]CAF5038725.1 unnamed protein product [Rotaria magnacalcarata]
MTSRFKSAIVHHTDSIKRSTLSGIKDTIRSRVTTANHDNGYGSNEFIHLNFYGDDNYLSIVKCINGGYHIAEDMLKFMLDYNDCLQKHIDNLKSCSKKSKSRVKAQSTLSSYNTTRAAQLKTTYAPSLEAEYLQARHDAIQEVIDECRTELSRIYPKESSNSSSKHNRTDYMIDSFEAARSVLLKLSEKLGKLKEHKAKEEAALLEAKILCENLSYTHGVKESKTEKANNSKKKHEQKLKDIENDIARFEDEYEHEKKTYRVEARRIYEKCRVLEEERLELIGDTLMKFIKTAYSSENSTQQRVIYKELKSYLKDKRDTTEDLDFWAQTYGVYDSTTSLSTETNQNDDAHNDDDDDDDDEPSSADTTTSSTKTKSKKNQK